MDDLSTRRPAARMTIATLATCAMVAFVLVGAPASADPTPFTAENFNPDTSGTGGPVQNATDDTATSVMSDLNDGVNSTFHATTVTTTNATSVQYYFCPTSFPDNQVDSTEETGTAEDPTQVAGCVSAAAADTTGVTPSGAGAGEAYEAEIDIPPGLDGSTQDLVAWVCSGTPANGSNCDAEVEPNVQLESAATGTDTTSGEIISPLHGTSLSNQGFTVTASTSTDVTAVTICLAALDGTPPAPSNTPADETGDPTQCVTDPDNDGTAGTPAIKTDVTPNVTQSTFKTWSVAFTDAETPDNMEMALVLFEGTDDDGDTAVPPDSPPAASGTGLCATGATDCQLDSHYVVSTPQTAATAKIVFPDEGGTSTLPNDCTETQATSSGESEPEQYLRVQGCILDQSGNNVTNSQHWAFQIAPIDGAGLATDETGFECQNPGQGKTCSDTNFPTAAPDSGEHQAPFGVPPAAINLPDYECNGRAPSPNVPAGSGCPSGPVGADGVQKDLNSDRFYESADGDPSGTAQGTAGIADEVAEFHTGGTYTITFCADSDNDAGTSPTPCTGEAVIATATNFTRATVDHVHAKKQGTTDAQCHTGEVFASAEAGSVVTLQGCALALLGTAESPAPGARVAWVLNPGAAPGSPGAIQNPQTLTDSNGQATAQVTSASTAGGMSTTVRFCLDEYPASTTSAPNGNGVCDSAESASGALAKTHADFRIDWTPGDGGPGGQCSASRDNSGQNEILIGTNGGDSICGFGGNDTIRGLGGPDTLKGGSGNDVLIGGSGPDKLRGSGGNDRMKGGSGNDSLKGQGGRDTASGGADDDVCSAEKEARSCER